MQDTGSSPELKAIGSDLLVFLRSSRPLPGALALLYTSGGLGAVGVWSLTREDFTNTSEGDELAHAHSPFARFRDDEIV